MSKTAIVKFHKIELGTGKPVKLWAMVVLDVPQAITAIAVLEQGQQRRFELAKQLGDCLDYLLYKYPNNVERQKQPVTLNVKTATGLHKESPKPVSERVAEFIFYALCMKDSSAVAEVVRQLGLFVAGKDVGVINACESPETII